MPHECQYPELGVSLQKVFDSIDTIRDSQKRTERRLDKIGSTVFGNGGDGHNTQIALLKQSSSRQWWTLGLIISGMAGLVAVIAFA